MYQLLAAIPLYYYRKVPTNSLLITGMEPFNINSIEVYPIEAYFIGKGAIEVSGCSRRPVIPKIKNVKILFS
jgi:hypothetical protein